MLWDVVLLVLFGLFILFVSKVMVDDTFVDSYGR